MSSPRHAIARRGSRPEVLSGEEVSRLIECVRNLKHRCFLLTLYSAGLRLNEAARLTIPDIDSKRMQLRVVCGKGAKERRVPLSPRLLTELREYWRQHRPPQYLFPGRTPDVPLAPTTIQKVCKAAAVKAGLERNITPHTMRHKGSALDWVRAAARLRIVRSRWSLLVKRTRR